jgi:hypothetical protein
MLRYILNIRGHLPLVNHAAAAMHVLLPAARLLYLLHP